VGGRGDTNMDIIVYDPINQQIFSQLETTFAWFDNDHLNITGLNQNFIFQKLF
jgi:hypothetical protein